MKKILPGPLFTRSCRKVAGSAILSVIAPTRLLIITGCPALTAILLIFTGSLIHTLTGVVPFGTERAVWTNRFVCRSRSGYSSVTEMVADSIPILVAFIVPLLCVIYLIINK